MKKQGFTLIEILVVATIISMLAAGGFVSYSTFTKKARDARRQADLEQIRGALEQYRSTISSYPLKIASGQALSDVNGNVYMSKVPSDPTSKYTYNFTNSATTYELCTYLEGNSNSPGGAGPICGAAACNYCVGPYGEVAP